MALPVRAGMDPGTLATATKDMIAIIAKHPLLSLQLCRIFIVSSLMKRKLIGEKRIVGVTSFYAVNSPSLSHNLREKW